MCFRPADVASAGPAQCPECGKAIEMVGGIELKACPFCGCDFTPYLNGSKPVPGAPAAPKAPVPRRAEAPGGPRCPEAPGGAFGPQAAERLVARREGELERSSSLPGSARFARDGRFREG